MQRVFRLSARQWLVQVMIGRTCSGFECRHLIVDGAGSCRSGRQRESRHAGGLQRRSVCNTSGVRVLQSGERPSSFDAAFTERALLRYRRPRSDSPSWRRKPPQSGTYDFVPFKRGILCAVLNGVYDANEPCDLWRQKSALICQKFLACFWRIGGSTRSIRQ